MKKRNLLLVLAVAFGLGFSAWAAEKTAGKAQEKCPVMGGKISKANYADVKGYRIYTCCPGCIGKISADPDKYIGKLKAEGIQLEKAPADSKPAAAKGGCGHCG